MILLLYLNLIWKYLMVIEEKTIPTKMNSLHQVFAFSSLQIMLPKADLSLIPLFLSQKKKTKCFGVEN